MWSAGAHSGAWRVDAQKLGAAEAAVQGRAESITRGSGGVALQSLVTLGAAGVAVQVDRGSAVARSVKGAAVL